MLQKLKFTTLSKNIFSLVKSPFFISLTIFGNLLIFCFSYIFYLLENGINAKVNMFIDALWWGFATATTVGYGDITPVSTEGKILGIVLMLTGTALFATYTAMFAQTILSGEFFRLSILENRDLETNQRIYELKKAIAELEAQKDQ